ncbi:proline-rich receptor-like protein kinase PERK10 isoform X2 [Sipha flava]|nr:proline-rich receptor-like protein kinase PERK10 isoform X2 [Sipha flava]
MDIMHMDQGSSAYNAWLSKTKLLKKIYDEFDLNIKMHEKPVGFTLTNKNNQSSGAHDNNGTYNNINVSDTTNDSNKLQHLPEGSCSFLSPSETNSVDFQQSQSTHYDIDNSNEYKNSPDLPIYYGSPEFSFKQSPQQHSSYKPPPSSYQTPPSSNEPSSPSYKQTHSLLGLLPSSYGTPPSSYKQTPSTNEPPPSFYIQPPPQPSPPPPTYGYPYNILPLNPNPGLVPPTSNSDPGLSTQGIGQFNKPDDEINNSNTEAIRSGLSTMDLYDLTLTVIAFLGFGTFVMNLVMDAISVQPSATLVMNSSPLFGASVSRTKRQVDPGVREINELSWTAVSMIDHMMANVDGTKINCEEVKQSCQKSKRLVKNGTNFSSKLLPVWNISLDWLSKKLGKDTGQPVISALLGHCTLPAQCLSKS